MPISPAYTVPQSVDDDAHKIVAAVERLYAHGASPYEQILGNVIRILGKYVHYRPIDTSSEDLTLLLAVSVALERSATRRKGATGAAPPVPKAIL